MVILIYSIKYGKHLMASLKIKFSELSKQLLCSLISICF